MSYILDALKKSEQERQRGDVPSLLTNHISNNEADSKKHWKSKLLVGVVILNCMFVVFWMGRYGVTESSGDAQVPASIDWSRSPETKSLKQHATNIDINSQKDADQKLANHSPTVSLQAIDQPSTRNNNEYLTKGVKQPQSRPDQPLKALSSNNTSIPTAESQSRFKNESAHRATTPSDISADSEQEKVIGLAQLPVHIRDQIPALAFSSHMYSSMPRYRNVIINGVSLKENQSFDSDLYLEKITEEGVILSYKGYRFAVGVIQQWNF